MSFINRMNVLASVFGMALVAAVVLTPTVYAGPISPALSGNTSFDGWSNLNATNYPGYGSFPGFTGWPGPIGSNLSGSGDADLNRVSGSAGGGPFLSSGSVYFGSFTALANAYGGTLSVTDTTAQANVENIVFQIEIGEATGFDFFNDALPVLSYNSGSQNLAADLSGIINRFQDGTFLNPDTNQNEPVWVNTYLLQWDVSSIAGITDFEISFDAVQHSQVYNLQLDQSDDYQALNVNFIPEPASILLLAAGSMALLRRRH